MDDGLETSAPVEEIKVPERDPFDGSSPFPPIASYAFLSDCECNAPNTLAPSGRGRHIHSTLPLGATSAVVSQSERKP